MFDPSFFELIIICVVALVVLGPDRLPGAIKTLGLWIGRLRRSFNSIKREIEQEVGADEIRRQLRNEAIMEKFNNTKTQITESIDSVKGEAESIKNDLNLKKQLSDVTDNLKGESDSSSSGASSDSIDPIEKLASSDPAARIIKPVTPEQSKSPVNTDSQTPASTKADETEKPDKTNE
ncbi:MAG: twin-arginine translocase subunit TatB [Gammaproteobacteria bacterium]|jgi:sec-independent protein translocase protein TatB|nr:twin-arginine translocase subunit TatB [Gammaproteobacteria bacterium]MBT6043421.1 twin-arginine translocase subunit TatB [Gammaproteobacteria bacterium]